MPNVDAAFVTNKAVGKYLSRGAEPEARMVLGQQPRAWERVVVLPCKDEDPTRVSRLRGWLADAAPECLLLVVSNGPAGSPRSPQAEALRKLVRPDPTLPAENMGWLDGDGCDALWVERCGVAAGIPSAQGVGRARKLGGDIALALWSRGAIRSPWIHYTDADATPSSCIAQMERFCDVVAVVWPFRHLACGDEELRRGHLKHEIWMRWWVRGLEYAGSPFAYHTIGSCMSVTMEGYAHVRGIPARAAGEDFHALCKLAKIGTVARGEGELVCIESRGSSRVPFGTGPAVARMRAQPETWRLSRPEVFEHLRQWLRVMRRIVNHDEDPWAPAGRDRGVVESAVAETMGAGWMEQLLKDNRGAGSLLRAHQWFDALKTLRFVHALERKSSLGPIAALEHLEEASGTTSPLLEAWCDSLRASERSFATGVGRARMIAPHDDHAEVDVCRWMHSPARDIERADAVIADEA